MAKTKYGYMKCPDCPERVVVKVNDNGTLSYGCDECESTAYARKGTPVYAAWDARITDKPAAPPREQKTPPPEGKPARKPSPLDGIL
jgi:hypothetical protein